MSLNIENNITKKVQLPIAYSCPHCNSTNFIRNGNSKGVQRYKCKLCSRTFKDSTGTPLHGLHKKEKIEKYLKALKEGMSIRKAAKYVGISKNTAFAWRHKMLASISKQPRTQESDSVAGIAIIRTPYSAKGRKKHPERYRKQSKSILIITDTNLTIRKLNNQRSSNDAIKKMGESIKESYAVSIPDALLSNALKHQENITKISSSKQSYKFKNKTLSCIDLLEALGKRFRGVASKYLQHYWSWYTAIHNSLLLKNEIDNFNSKALFARSLNNYKKIVKQ